QREELTGVDVEVDAAHGVRALEDLLQPDKANGPASTGLAAQMSQPFTRVANVSTLATNLSTSASSCCTDSSHCSTFPHGGRKTPPLCWTSQCRCPSRSSTSAKSRKLRTGRSRKLMQPLAPEVTTDHGRSLSRSTRVTRSCIRMRSASMRAYASGVSASSSVAL